MTPDSFYDGGKFSTIKNAISQAKKMIHEGVDIIAGVMGLRVTAPNNYVWGNLQVADAIVLSKIKNSTGTSCSFSGSSINVQGWKGFDIQHPNKKGHRLRHVCVEGPEASVYVRGTLKGSNIIELPEYWKGLVDPESITVTLTPVGSYQELYIKNIEWGQKVTVLNSTSGPIHCFYSVWASRIDGEPLIV